MEAIVYKCKLFYVFLSCHEEMWDILIKVGDCKGFQSYLHLGWLWCCYLHPDLLRIKKSGFNLTVATTRSWTPIFCGPFWYLKLTQKRLHFSLALTFFLILKSLTNSVLTDSWKSGTFCHFAMLYFKVFVSLFSDSMNIV